MSEEAYLALDGASDLKHEYLFGQVYAVGGGTPNHSIIKMRFGYLVYDYVERNKLDCTPFDSDARIFMPTSRSYVYADVMVVCGEVALAGDDPLSIANPMLIVEVASPSTHRYDRLDKFFAYSELPSLKEFVQVDPVYKLVRILYRSEPGQWGMKSYHRTEETVVLKSLGLEFSLGTLFKRTLA